jgi:hypothetical protein
MKSPQRRENEAIVLSHYSAPLCKNHLKFVGTPSTAEESHIINITNIKIRINKMCQIFFFQVRCFVNASGTFTCKAFDILHHVINKNYEISRAVPLQKAALN